jgi:F-type H+-transporting ATPase subunit b
MKLRRVLAWTGFVVVLLLPLVVMAASPEAGPHGAEAAGGHGAEAAHGAEHGGGIEWVTPILMNKGKTGLVWILINFAVLMWILDKLLFSKLRQKTADRHDQIKNELDKATAARKEAEGIIREYRQRMDKLDDEAAELMADAKRRAEADRKSIIAGAEEEAARIKSAATAAADREAEFRRRQLENEIVDRAVDRAEALLRQKLQPTDQKRMVDDYVQRIGSVDFGNKSAAAPGGAQ